ncbi:palmitoyltransferase zdhhc2 [Limosa lapponica baueri]|uniref:Palmitoyltransferase zdhhc2 n=1 Tax=Limosa lapponica baueri TaxID=1758121 RepID=A0A2I0TD47_LIMLA|nr:palmitoyltransferase zdhhc2 [Limosa lapponica baueri]
MTNIGEKVVCLVAYHIFFMLFVWSYWKTIFTLPMNPSKEFHLSYSDKESLEREPRGESQQEVLRRAAKDLPIYTRTMSGEVFRAPIFRHRTDKNGFSLGFSKNLRQVFGDEKKYWLVPVFSSENHLFPAKPLRDSQSHLLTDTLSWSETSGKTEKGKVGMSNPALTMENET